MVGDPGIIGFKTHFIGQYKRIKRGKNCDVSLLQNSKITYLDIPKDKPDVWSGDLQV